MDENLAALCAYLRTLALQKYPLDEYGNPVAPDGWAFGEMSSAPTIAREWAHELLHAADANGLGGCPLCQS